MEEEANLQKLEQESKALASCTYEHNTTWGTEQMGLVYGCAREDLITGLSIQSKGWKSVYYNPKRKAFLGVAPNTLGQTLVQHKRWPEGQLQIAVSKYNPSLYGYGKLSLGLQMVCSSYNLWAPNCLASLCLLKGIPLFPKV
ncbi:hypothetical protein K1719_013219 [Acacia pycnantha]|nr:hypothetical protein K1719_013219 [Acacia pycnantha]